MGLRGMVVLGLINEKQEGDMHILNWCVSGLVNSILLSQYPFHPDL
jgi:hypothetical protein